MNIKELAIKQYREIIDSTISKVSGLVTPTEGWLRTNRKALKMPASVILKKAGIKKSELYRIEKAELEGTLTLNKLKETAKAMDCEFYYAIVPKESIDRTLKERARRHAVKILQEANIQMKLEEQATTKAQIEYQVNELADRLVREMPAWFWDDDK